MKSKNHEIPKNWVPHLRDGRIVANRGPHQSLLMGWASVGIRAKHEPLFPQRKKNVTTARTNHPISSHRDQLLFTNQLPLTQTVIHLRNPRLRRLGKNKTIRALHDLLTKPYLRPQTSQSQKPEQVRGEPHLSPPTNILAHRRLTIDSIRIQGVTQRRSPQRNPAIQHRMKQPTTKRKHAGSIGRRSLRKEQHGQSAPVSLRHRRIHSPVGLRPAAPLYINRSRLRRKPTQQRPSTHLGLRHH